MSLSENIHTLLNKAQLEAVTYCDGPSVIVAGAGSGKTRVLTYKIAYLLEQGFPAHSILALTFTNKAAREMIERISQIVENNISRYLWAGTFHSIFLRILRQEVDAIGFLPNFSIYDTQDSKALVKSIIKELKLDEKTYKASAIFNRISALKNRLISPKEYEANGANLKQDYHSGKQYFIDIFETYCKRCQEANAMDFDDILLHTYYLFKNSPDILTKYQSRFGFILVDEYQDTNTAQHKIIGMLAAIHKRIAVVGDDAQSIYSFRGANIENILSFQKNFEGCRIFKLEENYRSTKNIVNAANSLIQKNRFQIPKSVFSNLTEGEKIKVISCFTDRNEADTIASEIENAISNGTKKENIAVLYRTNAQSRVIEDALLNKSIPYRIYGGLSFYARKEIKDVLAYMRLIINNSDTESLKRIINYPTRGIGEKTLGKLLQYSYNNHIAPITVILELHRHNIDVNSGSASKLKKFGHLISNLKDICLTKDAYEAAEQIIKDSGIIDDLSSNDDSENISRRENIQELLNAIYQYSQQREESGDNPPLLADFLAEVSLMTDQDMDENKSNDVVTMMTIHASKGLEFEYVFIAGIEEELLPSSMSESERDIEEERRLFYVAITRAKSRCMMSYAKSRFRWGNISYSHPSRFLNDIDTQYLDIPTAFNPYEVEQPQLKQENKTTFPSFIKKTDKVIPKTSNPSIKTLKKIEQSRSIEEDGVVCYDFKVGDSVSHLVFGIGTIIEMIHNGNNSKAKINFTEAGLKTLLLKYSKLTKL